MKKIFSILSKLIYKIIIFPVKHRNSTIRSHVPKSCQLGKKLIIEKNCIIGNDINIGDYTFIGSGTRIETNTESIGKYCSIAPDVKIGVGPHPINYFSTSPVFYAKYRGVVKEDMFDEYKLSGFTIIEHDVWIGTNAVILAGVRIGTGAVVGSGAVVTKDVEPYAIVGGVPAKLIKYRFDRKTIDRLLESKWWEKDIEILSKNPGLFDKIEDFISELEKENDSR